MTIISLLIRLPGQEIARPMNRAWSAAEAEQLILDRINRAIGYRRANWPVIWSNLNTDKAVAAFPVEGAVATIYAFTED